MSSPQLLRASLESLRDCPEELIEIIVRQAAALEELQKQVKDLQDQIRDLNDRNNGLSSQVEALEKTAARQAAPFRIADKHRSADPKKPGRPQGHPGTHRWIPDHVDQEIIVGLERCPQCGERLTNSRPLIQYI